MSMIRGTSPFGELLSLRQAMDRLFEDSFVRPRGLISGPAEGFGVPLDVRTTADAVIVEAALPGFRPEDVDITVTGDSLTITASNTADEQAEEGEYLYRELRRGTFGRTLTLPTDLKADGATASFEHGLLRLVIPKAEEAKPRQIRIAARDGSTGDATSAARPVGTGAVAD